jgi:porin
MKIFRSVIAALVLATFGLACPVLGQETTQVPGKDTIHSSHFGGPSSVKGMIVRDHKEKAAVLQPYLDFKARLKKDYGFTFGADYNALFQAATESLGEDTAAGGVVRFFGHWELLGRDSGNTGTLVFKVENRHRLGTDIVPQDLGSEVGYVGLTAQTFSDIDWALTNLFWEQKLWRGRVAFLAGVVDITDYVDTYSLVNPWSDFLNQAFGTNPTIPAPGQGLGAALETMMTDNIYLVGGLADANGDPTDPGDSFDSFFDTAEYFSHFEMGWIPSFKERFSNNVHLTAWHADTREEAGVPSGWGLAFSWNRLFNETWEPFVRVGYADDGGALWEQSVSIGFSYHLKEKSDLVGLGLNWGKPSEDSFGPGLDDQYTAELFYRFQLMKFITITPDVQLLVNPALNPDDDLIAIFGIRVRFNF